jgi:hypothetical protein
MEEQNAQSSGKRVALVDTLGNVSYSLLTGALLDYNAGLDLAGIAASRASGTAINSVTGAPYGWWREKVFKTTKTNEESGRVRRTLTDLLAFNTFQMPIYATAVAIGSLVSDGDINWEKVMHGAEYLTIASPLVGPTMGLWMDGCRRLFRVKSAAKGAYERKEE